MLFGFILKKMLKMLKACFILEKRFKIRTSNKLHFIGEDALLITIVLHICRAEIIYLRIWLI